MKQINKNIIKILVLLFFMVAILLCYQQVEAAGVDGTVIVLNPRTWWNMDRMC